jgi:glucokinase-like ROK family protein
MRGCGGVRVNTGNAKLVKEVNKRLVFQLIRREHAVSRADISRILGLSPTTVSSLVNELTEEGLVMELGCGTSRRGRRPIIYQMNPNARFVVGADVGSNVLTVIVTDLNGKIIEKTEANIDDQAGQELVTVLYEEINHCIEVSKVNRSDILGVGIASPGLIDYNGGTVIQAINVDWDNVPLKGILEHELDLPVYIENMNNAAALGEYSWGLGREVKRFLYLNVGRGVGGGIIVDGRVLQGSGVSASEIGHLIMDRHGDKCRCGARGCLEALVSSKAIEKQARELVKQFPNSIAVELARSQSKPITLEILALAAKQNDPLAVNVLMQAAEWLGIAVAGLINIFNPDVVMLGGRVIRSAEDMILGKLRSIARENSFSAFFEMVTFMTPRLGHLSSALGAVSFVVQEEFDRPLIEFGDLA